MVDGRWQRLKSIYAWLERYLKRLAPKFHSPPFVMLLPKLLAALPGFPAFPADDDSDDDGQWAMGSRQWRWRWTAMGGDFSSRHFATLAEMHTSRGAGHTHTC